jgi:hypothetical protein
LVGLDPYLACVGIQHSNPNEEKALGVRLREAPAAILCALCMREPPAGP